MKSKITQETPSEKRLKTIQKETTRQAIQSLQNNSYSIVVPFLIILMAVFCESLYTFFDWNNDILVRPFPFSKMEITVGNYVYFLQDYLAKVFIFLALAIFLVSLHSRFEAIATMFLLVRASLLFGYLLTYGESFKLFFFETTPKQLSLIFHVLFFLFGVTPFGQRAYFTIKNRFKSALNLLPLKMAATLIFLATQIIAVSIMSTSLMFGAAYLIQLAC